MKVQEPPAQELVQLAPLRQSMVQLPPAQSVLQVAPLSQLILQLPPLQLRSHEVPARQ